MKGQNNSRKISSRRKYIITAVIFLSILAGLIYRAITWTPMDSESKKQSEAIIRQAAAAQLNKDPNELTDEDFARITEITISQKEMSDIKFLEKFTNLQDLHLTSIEFPEKEIPLLMKILSKLGIINLSERFSIDLSPLEKLTHLKILDLESSQIFDIEPLKNLTNLQVLSLRGTLVSDLEPINGLSNIQVLILNNTNQISDLEPIKGLVNMEQLELNNTQVSDLNPIREFNNLRILHLINTKVSDLELIKDLTKLTELHLHGTQVLNLEPIAGLINLKLLHLPNTQVSNLEAIKKMKNLQIINISSCENITDEQVDELQKALPDLHILHDSRYKGMLFETE